MEIQRILDTSTDDEQGALRAHMSSIAQAVHRTRPPGLNSTRSSSRTIAASSVGRALGIVGDRWALQILGANFAGIRRFEELQARLGAARSTLASRLSGLVASGVLERVLYQDTPPRSEYRLSKQGAELYGVTLLIGAWERAWTPGSVAAAGHQVHKACGHVVKPELTCMDCADRVTFFNTDCEIVAAVSAGRRSKPLFRRLSPVAAVDGTDNDAAIQLTDIIGDRWTLLVLSAGFLGMRRFDAIQKTLHVATNILTHRLNRLVATGLFERRLYLHHPPRCEYRLTQKGRDLFPVTVTLMQWADRWLAPPGRGNLRLVHRECGRRLRAAVTCGHCAAPLEEPGDVVRATVEV